LGLANDGLQALPDAGRVAALETLDSFLHQRGQNYTREMSSPVTAEHACSRLSWYLAYGSLSMREVAQAAWARYRELPPSEKAWAQSMRSFIARLHWHCHFVQKLESEPEAEWRPFAKIYEGLRPRPADTARLAAWSEGRTGYPFIDAAMRYLNATGWINFRMRAMLMSFASYDLWLPWQESGLALARKFIDYEPGIHWPQSQMQAGETGINTVRIYSPVKQGYDQDPKGHFIRQWVPELAAVPEAYLHEPWKLAADDRAMLCPDYPERIVDHSAATKAAKDKIYALRRKPEARAEAKAVVQRHGSRKRTADWKRKGAEAAQMKLSL
jgi:deoxyribodipyrimidine photo-lyase